MCTSPLIRFRCKVSHLPSNLPLQDGVSGYFSILSLKKMQKLFGSFSYMYESLNKYFDYQYLPCRKCDECKANYSSEWSVRTFHEFQMRKIGCFLTLTIDSSKCHLFTDNEKIMKRYCKRCVNGNRFFNFPIDYTLCKGLIQDWLKSFRDIIYKRYGIKIRYFGCGEYGEKEQRPHYHILIFGFDFRNDRMFFKKSSKGVDIFLSEELSKLWPYGMATLQDINHQACMYTAKYVTKKLKFNNEQSEFEMYYGRQPEFLLMSKGNCQSNRCKHIDDIIKNCKGLNSLRNLKNPYCVLCDKTRGGLGYDWLFKYFDDVVKLGFISIEGVKYPIPKYYLELIKLTDLEIYDKLKIKVNMLRDELEERHPEYNSVEYLEVKKQIIRNKLKHYRRE